MSNHKLQCPICNQEFPAYDQRGFRNAGFTSHRNRCIERQQQKQNEPQQHDKQSSRASRFAMAIKRRLLPAQPLSSTPTSTALEARRRNSILSVLPGCGPGTGSGSGSSSSSPLLPSHCVFSHSTALFTPIVPSQAPLQHQPVPRQRHTWNHWNKGKEVRRSTSASTQDKACSSLLSPPIIPSSTLPSDLSHSISSSTCRVLHNTSDAHKESSFPLLKTITTLNSTTALIIPQTTPTYTFNTPISSPTLPGNSPFSFISMLTTLPLESTPPEPSSNSAISSSSSNGNFKKTENTMRHRHHSQPGYSLVDMQQLDPVTNDWMMDNGSSATNDHSFHQSISQQSCRDHSLDHRHIDHDSHHIQSINHHSLIEPPCYDQHQYSFPAQFSENHVVYLQNINTSSTTSSTTTTSPSMTQPTSMDQLDTVSYCGCCQPHNGLHDPSCSLLEFIMTNIMHGDGSDTSS